ncbi:hypothetical protein DdX_11049 [Ditylenchus destructor]|uniref:Uncharacterized protein n=1 Tax=Ditylenchus destructor TaxID=166010 RepID=A0AAD4N0L1_9BILA|nr:hypothetical protein DdX_11049 [Ditylenchus destructor]
MNKLQGLKYFVLIVQIIISLVDGSPTSSDCECHYKGSFVNGEPDVGTCANWINYATCEQLCDRKSHKQLMDEHPMETRFCGKPKILLPQSRVKSKDHRKLKVPFLSDLLANVSSHDPDSSGTEPLPSNELNGTQNSTAADSKRIYQINIYIINIGQKISRIPWLDQSIEPTLDTNETRNETQACQCPRLENNSEDPEKLCKNYFKTVKCWKKCGVWDDMLEVVRSDHDAIVQKCAEFGISEKPNSTSMKVIGFTNAIILVYQIFAYIIYVT